jgi:hypothetical protein
MKNDDDRSTIGKDEELAVARRKLLKAAGILTGTAALGHLSYVKPEVRSFFGARNAYAFQTSPTTIIITGNLGILPPGTSEDTGQDAYTFRVLAGATLTITVTVDANLWPEIGLFAPGTTTSDTNLLTGSGGGLASPGQGIGLTTTPLAVGPGGVYTFAIEDNFGDPETAGAYTVTIASDRRIWPATQILDEGPETLAPSS